MGYFRPVSEFNIGKKSEYAERIYFKEKKAMDEIEQSKKARDIDILARTIYGEARGESYVGQVAVGAVVMNRIKSASFPNTMAGVIYQSYAFTAVNDGQINLTPDATAKKAAQDAMNGWDPTYGAIYYYNPAIATSSWIFSRKTTVTIGNHVFAK